MPELFSVPAEELFLRVAFGLLLSPLLIIVSVGVNLLVFAFATLLALAFIHVECAFIDEIFEYIQ